MIDCVAVVSGGLDSVTLLHWLVKSERRQPAVLTFSYGQRHRKELEFARWQTAALACRHHQLLDLYSLRSLFAASALVDDSASMLAMAMPTMADVEGDPQPPTYVPNRNMVFLSLGAALAESLGVTELFYGAQRHDLYGYWDTTADFVSRINALLALNRRRPVQVRAPFVDLSKAEVIRLGLSLGVDYAHTWSCYQGGAAPCGRCPTCAERQAAFAALGLADPLPGAVGGMPA